MLDNVGARTPTEDERIKRMPSVLNAYAAHLERWPAVDSDFAPFLRRVAKHLESCALSPSIAPAPTAPVSLPVIPRAKLDELEALAVKMHDNRILSGSIGPLMNAGFADGSQVSAGMLRKWIAEQSADAVAVSGEGTK